MNKKGMETIQDLIEEAKTRTVWWALCIFVITYFLSHTSKSMWMNLPISILLLCAIKILLHEVEFRWRVQPARRETYLSHLEKKQLSVDDPCLSSVPPSLKWKRKVDSPLVESAIDDFINKLLQDFVVDLWYSSISPDREVPEQMRSLINDILGEISGRVKQINLVDLLTRDMVDLIGNHLELYRRNQSAIGVEVMGTLSFEERDDRLKHHLITSKELHPALISPECEYKFLQRLMGGLLAVVLRSREAQCPLVRSIARELLTCLVMQPIMNLASPGYINELIEYLFLAKDDEGTGVGDDHSAGVSSHCNDHFVPSGTSLSCEPNSKNSVAISNQRSGVSQSKISNERETSASTSTHDVHGDPMQPRPADWARVFEAATQRRSEVLAPENLENMWTKGRNYKNKHGKHKGGALPPSTNNSSGGNNDYFIRNLEKERLTNTAGSSTYDKAVTHGTHWSNHVSQHSDGAYFETNFTQNQDNRLPLGGSYHPDKNDQKNHLANENKTQLKRSSSTSALKTLPDNQKVFTREGVGATFSEEFYSADLVRHKEVQNIKTDHAMVISGEGHAPKLKCRVIGAYFEKTGSKSFAVYSIVVRDMAKNTWFVKRRYRNFERLHRHLKDIPNYTLHLPPKRFLSSSIDDEFVHRRCIQLDQYLQDLLSIANVAEQHEVFDFLSVSSKNYSFGKSPSVMKTLAVNVDDAMDDFLRQFKGVSDGLIRKVSGSSPLSSGVSYSISNPNLSWSEDEMNKNGSSHHDRETLNSLSDNEERDLDGVLNNGEDSVARLNGWHSDNELNSKEFPPRIIKRDEDTLGLGFERNQRLEAMSLRTVPDGYPAANFPIVPEVVEEPVEVPPEWTPPNVSVPLLNLVDKTFQLNRRGWLRRQVFWISKQILQLVMEDAIDDWLLRQIHWLRRDDVIALGIRWIKDVLWPDGTFFIKFGSNQSEIDASQFSPRSMQIPGKQASKPGAFEEQLEAARRASDIKKMILGGAPTTLVSLIGPKQYKRCARDVYYFLQSSICLKQLAYRLLELLLVSIFPELRHLVLDINEKMQPT